MYLQNLQHLYSLASTPGSWLVRPLEGDISDIWYSFKIYFFKLFNSELYFLQSVQWLTHLLSVARLLLVTLLKQLQRDLKDKDKDKEKQFITITLTNCIIVNCSANLEEKITTNVISKNDTAVLESIGDSFNVPFIICVLFSHPLSCILYQDTSCNIRNIWCVHNIESSGNVL